MRIQGVADFDRQLADPVNDRFEGVHEREHDLSASLGLELPSAALGAVAQAGEQLARWLRPV